MTIITREPMVTASERYIDDIPSYNLMSHDCINMILNEMANHTVRFKSDAYFRIHDMIEKLGLFVHLNSKLFLDIIGFREDGVDWASSIVINPRNPEYESFLTYAAWKEDGKLYERMKKVSLPEAIEFINKYFDRETFRLKEEYKWY